MTSSPTRLISWSTFSTLTRKVLDSGEAATLASTLGATGLAAGASLLPAPTADRAEGAVVSGAPGASSKKP